MASKRNEFLDVLKGIAMLFILITHYDWSETERLKYFFPYWIDMSVSMLMVISGYVYTKSYKYKEICSFKVAYSIKNISKSIIRYTVPFIFAYIIECVVFEIMGIEVNYLFFFLRGADGPGSYYYPIMMQFIFVFPVIYFIVDTYRFKGMLMCLGINAVYELLQSAYGMNEECYRLLLFRYFFLISVGCYLNYYEEEKEEMQKVSKWLVGISALVGGMYIWLVCYTEYTPTVLVYWTRTSFLASLYILPIISVAILRGKWSCKPLEILGKASYNIYLVQMVVYLGESLIYALISSRIMQFVFCITLSLVGGLVFYLVEQPLTRFILEKFNNAIRC